MRASKLIESLKDENASLREYCEVLKGALVSASIEVPERMPESIRGLTPQCQAILGVLFACYPAPRTIWDLLECLPERRPGSDRDGKQIGVLIWKIRQHLGKDVIDSKYGGDGYALSKRGRRIMKGEEVVNDDLD